VRYLTPQYVCFFFKVYFARVFPHERHFAAWHALALLGGGASAYLGGLVADRWQANNPAWLAWLPALGGLAAVPLLVLCLQAKTFSAAMGLLAAAYAVGEVRRRNVALWSSGRV